VPDWIVVTAGTGGTSATIGRYIHYKCFYTRLCVADPENSVFYDAYQDGDRTLTIDGMSRIEGIGRPKVEPSFIPSVIDRMIRVPDAASIAAIQLLERLLNRRCGGSTGTNLYAAFQIMSELNTRGRVGSLVTLLCDSGERYLDTYYNADWIASQGLDPTPYAKQLDAFCETGVMPSP
jgi:cysteine synthase A